MRVSSEALAKENWSFGGLRRTAGATGSLPVGLHLHGMRAKAAGVGRLLTGRPLFHRVENLLVVVGRPLGLLLGVERLDLGLYCAMSGLTIFTPASVSFLT